MNVPCQVCGGSGERLINPNFTAATMCCAACGGRGYQDDHNGAVFTVTYADAEGMRQHIASLEAALRALCDATEARLALIDGRSIEARELKDAIAAGREALKP